MKQARTKGFTPLESLNCDNGIRKLNDAIPRSRFPWCKRSRSLTGFTLIEVVISLVVLGILASGIFATFSFSKRMSLRAQDKAVAISIVEKKMNELKQAGVANLPPVCDSALDNCQKETVNLGQWGGALMTGTLITEVKETVPTDPNMKEVKVTLRWADRLGQVRTIPVVTAMYGGAGSSGSGSGSGGGASD